MIFGQEAVARFVAVLKPLVLAERQAETIETHEAYLQFRERQKALNDWVLGEARMMVEQTPGAGLDDMRELYRVLLDHPDLGATDSDRAVTGAILSEAWAGLQGWVK